MHIYRHEKPLFVISAVISTIFWLLITVGTLGVALFYLLLFFLLYLFTQSALISYLKGTAVKISEDQFPDLYQSVASCAQTLQLAPYPEAYLLHGNGLFNAFATRFLGRNFIVLYSDVVDALEPYPDAMNFYIGHEFGHIQRKHLKWAPFLAPSSVLPLLGTAYSRAREYTCDQFGLACCASSEGAVRGLSALAAGHNRWRKMNIPQYLRQGHETGGFWMSFHELTADYPWLVKRVARVAAEPTTMPRRNIFAWILSAFVPRLGIGGGPSIFVLVAIIGVLAAIAIPQFQVYKAKAEIISSLPLAQRTSKAVENYYYQHHALPQQLEDIGISSHPDLPFVKEIDFNANNGTIKLVYNAPGILNKSIDYTPRLDKNRKIFWTCSSDDIPANYLPPACK